MTTMIEAEQLAFPNLLDLITPRAEARLECHHPMLPTDSVLLGSRRTTLDVLADYDLDASWGAA
jgi:hypothetical protein